MTPEIKNLIIGFVLTTLCGGLLGFIFQRRHERYQWLRNRSEKELEVCQAVFEEVSRILDKRLYRSRQLLQAIKANPFDDAKLASYREVVTQWNENINRILALLTISFGEEVRNTLDNDVGAEFVKVGRLLEQAIREKTAPNHEDITARLDAIGNKVYQFNLSLLQHIQTKRNQLYDF
jgi:hypothetical protein